MSQSKSRLFDRTPEAPHGVTPFRQNILRVLFFINFALLGIDVWVRIIGHEGPWDQLHGVAYSVWAAFSLISFMGMFFPLQMILVLVLQMLYKAIWLLVIAIPMIMAGNPPQLLADMTFGVFIELALIPWPFVIATYITQPRAERAAKKAQLQTAQAAQ